ncbi:MAG TPA: EF-P lysine aminoacylase EpmA [Steroidobacteraceae bacterium]|nr:EF-P lysine aminoacylase EpmA [Steroidobacteraceae bacterium]
MTGSWRPTAGTDALRLRARLLGVTREFFRDRGILEVETPVAVAHGVTDVQLASLQLATHPPRYLQTSPEYAMKRLLAAGCGDIFQVARVFRADERSALHNPEFTMVEWYRLGMSLQQIMAETAALAAALLREGWRPATAPVEYLSYQQAFGRELGIDPLTAGEEELRHQCAQLGLAGADSPSTSRDDLLDFLVATRVGPRLGGASLTLLHHYPASQAALAQLDPEDARTALRFELYARGVELANGYVELSDAAEQSRRFAADRSQRQQRGLPDITPDENLLAALAHGLPRCAGVALGFDRVVMLAAGATRIDEVLAFPWERA